MQAPDGTIYALEDSGTFRIEIQGDSDTIEFIALDEAGIPLGTYSVLAEQETIPNEARPLSAWLWVLGGIVIIGGIGATVYFLWRKGKTAS